MNKLFILLLSIVIFTSCSKNKDIEAEPAEQKRPLVDFKLVPGDDPFTFTFENNSKEYKSLEWRFGDDSVSREVTPTHVFATAGTFEINLKAIAEDGSTATRVHILKILPEDGLSFVAESQGSNKVKFSVKTTNVVVKSLLWDFGDGSAGSEDPTPTKEYAPTKLFTSKVRVTTEKGSVFTVSRIVASGGTVKDITSNHLLNVGPNFVPARRFGGRWGIIADWTVNDAVKQREGGMGSWDSFDNNSMSMESWGQEPDIVNGKIEQTTLLPLEAGEYYFAQEFVGYQIKNEFYTVAAKGKSLPDITNIENNANVLGFTKTFGSAGDGPNDPQKKFTTYFKVPAKSDITIGFVATLNHNDQYCRMRTLRLYQLDK
ncbi:DUF5013 domain-containing protein [Pedobacter sp. B4-66]|uniref:DUF5013 domain-containing protein n=1 Tax=Pedobacter sp. B4-66 TaxID=2817280 RepID=UPI001BDB1946|nr:DUF5013 domain-containing protein [Pedobacter sp. B4-66]